MLILSYKSDGVKCPPQGLKGPNCEFRVLPNVSGEPPESSKCEKPQHFITGGPQLVAPENPCCHVPRPVKDLTAQQQREIPQQPTLITKRQSLRL